MYREADILNVEVEKEEVDIVNQQKNLPTRTKNRRNLGL